MSVTLDNGDRRTCRMTFRDAGGSLADPTEVTLHHRKPQRDPVAYKYTLGEVTRISLGIFEKAITFEISGRHILKAEGDGAIVAATPPLEVNVRHDRFAAVA